MDRIEKIVKSLSAPQDKTVLWLDLRTYVLKGFRNGEWVPIGASGASDSVEKRVASLENQIEDLTELLDAVVATIELMRNRIWQGRKSGKL